MGRRDDEEFVQFATAAQPQLRRTAYLLCGDWHRASDLAQEALIKVYVAWPRLQRGDGLHGYARKALMSVAVDAGRKRSSLELPTDHLGERAGADFSSEIAERGDLLEALRALPPRQRACVVLRFFEDLSVEATAHALGCSTGNVKSQTSRGLDTLRKSLNSLELGEVGSW